MEFGDRMRFGASMELLDDHGGASLFGKFCYWIGGQQLGRYDHCTSLRDLLFQLDKLPNDKGRRFSGELFDARKDVAFWRIDRELYRDDRIVGITAEDLLPVEEAKRFEICPSVDILDSWKIYVVEWRDRGRVLYKHHDELFPSEWFLRSGEVDNVVLAAWRVLAGWYETEVGMEIAWGKYGPPSFR